jgi:Xaa-Pro dipeptidase
MVVTVEPGIYFSVYALQHFYLPSPIHSKYINVDMLQRYLPVGGVRIEDDILITSRGYENLTTAPKGDAMLDIIRHGKSGSSAAPDPKPRSTSRERSGRVEPSLVRAPGISNNMPQSIQRPLARAATMLAEFKPQETVDFEPFAGPSLFSNFTRSMTTEEKIQQWRQKRSSVDAARNPSPTVKQLHPVCGQPTPNFQHVYLSNDSSRASLSRSSPEFESPTMCRNCVILVQTLDRLRQTLTNSVRNSPKLEAKPVPETSVRIEMPVDALDELAEDQNHAKELQSGKSARNMRLHRELPIRSNLASHAGPSASAVTSFATRYTPSQDPHPVSARNSVSPLPLPREQSSARTVHGPPQQLSRRVTDRSSTTERRNPAGLPTLQPPIPTSNIEATLQKYESLRLRLDALEEGARIRAQRQDQPVRSHRQPISRPSMPNLMSENPWQQHSTQPAQGLRQDHAADPSHEPLLEHNVRSRVSETHTTNRRPAALTSRRTVGIETLMVDGQRRERDQMQERQARDAWRRHRYSTR